MNDREENAAWLWLERAREETEERIMALNEDIETFEKQLGDCRKMLEKSKKELQEIEATLLLVSP